MTATDTTILEAVLRRDRAVVVAVLVSVIAVAWTWLLLGAGTGMTAVTMTFGSGIPGLATMVMEPAEWSVAYAGLMFAMWWAMMAAMMLPSAAPILLLFARLNRSKKADDRPLVPTGIFAVGYLAAWGGFSALATASQWELERLGVLSPMMATTSYRVGAAILLAAGVWQLTPIKGMCLRHCRSPIGFLVQSWRPGRSGAFKMGLAHGSYCLGCCWFLMGLLFFGGIMNLLWIIGLAAFVLVEKTVPMGSWIGRTVGIALVVWGALLLATTTLTVAAPSDYRYEAVELRPNGAGRTTIAVRLVRAQDNKPVEGVVVLDARTDMGPSGMADMSGKVTPISSDQPGLYRFAIETGMAGKWELILTAKVQGEADPVTGTVTYDAE